MSTQRLVTDLNNGNEITLAPGAEQDFQHHLHEAASGSKAAPTHVFPDRATPIQAIFADKTIVRLKNPTSASQTARFRAERKHTIEEDPKLLIDLLWQGNTVGGGGLPPFSGDQYAVLMENPGFNAVFQWLTEDMILPAFSATLACAPTDVEVGATVNNPVMTASYVRPPVTVICSDGGPPVPIPLPALAFIFAGIYTKIVVNATQVFTLAANEAGGPTKMATAAIGWRPRVFWDNVVPPGVFTAAWIQALVDSTLAAARQRTIAYNAVGLQKLYYAYPASYSGAPGNFTDQATGFAAGFSKVAAGIVVTNPYGVAVPYDVWGSDQAGLGAVNIIVT
jgi:hypothetical protein